jgi:periplasmic divalent cation tolerance protein
MVQSNPGGTKLNRYILVLTTVPDLEVGQIIAEKVIEDRLAACVTLSAATQSVYWWQGKISREPEYLLIIKTKLNNFSRLEEKIGQIHPYEVPEIIALPILTGSKKYLEWIDRETRP